MSGLVAVGGWSGDAIHRGDSLRSGLRVVAYWDDNRREKDACPVTLLISTPEGLAPVSTVASQEPDKPRAT